MKPDEQWAQWLPEDPREPVQGKNEEASVIRAVESWAQEPEGHEAFDAGALLRGQRQSTRSHGLRLPLSLAAAALFLFALSQTQFQVQVGALSLNWGSAVTTTAPVTRTVSVPAPEELTAAVEENKATAAQLAQQVQALAERDAALEISFQQAVSVLLENQQVEALARYNDVQQLLQMSQGNATQYQSY